MAEKESISVIRSTNFIHCSPHGYAVVEDKK